MTRCYSLPLDRWKRCAIDEVEPACSASGFLSMKDGPKDPDTKTHWAEERTDWAEDRTVLANERTFAGWLRTSLGAVAVALGLKAVFGDFDPTWAAKSVATVFVVAAILMIWLARNAAVGTASRMSKHSIKTQTTRRITVLASVLSFGAAATGLILWML